MGHANYGNLCDLFVNLLYARGKLTVGQAVEVAARRGETLHASEGDYDAESGMVGMALAEYCHFLTCDRAEAASAWGWRRAWEGPFIGPVLRAGLMRPKGFATTTDIDRLVLACYEPDAGPAEHAVAADAIEEAGSPEWAAYVRDLPAMRDLYRRWRDPGEDTADEWELFDRIPWAFLPGWRKRYRDIPRLGNVTH